MAGHEEPRLTPRSPRHPHGSHRESWSGDPVQRPVCRGRGDGARKGAAQGRAGFGGGCTPGASGPLTRNDGAGSGTDTGWGAGAEALRGQQALGVCHSRPVGTGAILRDTSQAPS